MWEVRPEQWATRQAICEIEELVHAYHAGTKALPKSLEEVRGALSLQASFQWDEKGRPLDGWGRPFLYSTDGAKFVIISLGRDGKPGGLGLDCDLSNTNTWPANTFSQCYLNDLICIPFWVPIMLYGLRRLPLSANDAPPQSYEILIPLIVWSFCLSIGCRTPLCFGGEPFSDHVDIMCYTLGGLGSALLWRRWYRKSRAETISHAGNTAYDRRE